ncbi:hypothetical protein ACRC6Q_18860 [Planococcus sp. SE5232]|uniref:hypothetical protein n=1 Tax=unclassified Planococcus (in: firmicutes) TaxID=2662419 RepID=UPI003D6B4983
MEKNTDKMILLVKGQGNWSLYIRPSFNMTTVFSIAHEGSGAKDSVFGNLSYFTRWLKQELKINSSIETGITPEGRRILTETK